LFIKLDDKYIIQWMIEYYCFKKHNNKKMCNECIELFNYALVRIQQCPYGEFKPTCSSCPIHCYNPDKREQIKNVMKFSGPAILFRKPVTGVKYLLKKKLYKPVRIKNP